MTARRIVVIQGHPDASRHHLCHALAQAYALGAQEGGHAVRQVDIAKLDFALLRSQQEWDEGPVPPCLAQVQADIRWADHVVLLFPLWLGDMPALVKGFLEQVARPGFAFTRTPPSGGSSAAVDTAMHMRKGLVGRSARVVVTMGMPALVYRWYFRAHSVRSLERNILGFVGFAPVHRSLIGMVGQLGDQDARRWLARMQALGAAGS